MKKLFLVFLVTTTLFSFNNITLDKNDLIGKWKGEDNSEVGYLSFIDEKNAVFEIGGQTFGGENFEVDGKPYNLVYTTDFTKTPIEVDFIVTEITTKDTRTLMCIVEFIDKDSIKFAIGFQGERPQSFEGKQSIILNRIK